MDCISVAHGSNYRLSAIRGTSPHVLERSIFFYPWISPTVTMASDSTVQSPKWSSTCRFTWSDRRLSRLLTIRHSREIKNRPHLYLLYFVQCPSYGYILAELRLIHPCPMYAHTTRQHYPKEPSQPPDPPPTAQCPTTKTTTLVPTAFPSSNDARPPKQ